MNELAIKKSIEKKIQRLIAHGKTEEIAGFKRFQEEEDIRDAFFNKLMMWGYTQDRKERKKLFEEAKVLAKKLPDLKGWPEDARTFWNVESYGWITRIPKELRLKIREEILKYIDSGLNLSLGCGSCPYVDGSVAADFSEGMLRSIPNSFFNKKVLFDLEKGFPFKPNSFDSVTMVFVVDYLNDLKNIFREVKRVLKKNGKLLVVQSRDTVDEFYRIQENRHLSAVQLRRWLQDFKVNIQERTLWNKDLLFLEAKV